MLLIESADATPPHLDVLLRLGGSLGMHGSLQFFAFGLLSLFSFLSVAGLLLETMLVSGHRFSIDFWSL